MLLALFAIGIIWPGLAYKRWAWDYTESARFGGDINRNFTFGLKALRDGYLNLYEDDIRDKPSRGLRLDYTPLRLLMFEGWAAWNLRTHPDAAEWVSDYDFSAPLMNFYTSLEWLGSLAAMLIVVLWLRRCAQANAPPAAGISPWTGVVRGMLAFTLLWFDPGVAIIAHGWPSPNMCVIPFYLWTVLFCLCDRWFIAGLVMGVGVMLQGQQMLVAPIFILWPLFAGRPTRAMRWVCGCAIAFMGVAAGWMLSVRPDLQQQVRHVNWPAVLWVAGALAMLTVLAFRARIPWQYRREWWLLPVGIALLLIIWPAFYAVSWAGLFVTIAAAALAIAAMWWLSWNFKRYLLPLCAAVLLLACVPFFGASTAWWEIGFLYGAERFPYVGGSLANNLSSILHFNFRWADIDQICFTVAPGTLWGFPAEPMNVNNRQVLFTIYLCFFALAGFGIARQWRREGPNLLVALVVPWVLFFTLLPQMSPRYAVFAAGVGAICIGRSVGMSLLVWYFSALTVMQTALCMMMGNGFNRGTYANELFNADMLRMFDRISRPGLSWATLLAAAVFLWIGLTGAPRRPCVAVEKAAAPPEPESLKVGEIDNHPLHLSP